MAYPCRICNKQFQSPEALEQHRKAAHADHITSPSSGKKYVAWILIIALIAGVGYGLVRMFSPASQADIALAQCIAASGAKFYGAFWCPHCQDQKTMFGGAANYLPYIECSNTDRSQKEICSQAGIDAYPTWVFADGTRGNVMTKVQLSQRTGCPFTTE